MRPNLACSLTVLAFCGATAIQGPIAIRRQECQRSQLPLWTVDLTSASYGGGAIGKLDGELTIVFGTYYNDEHLYAVRARDGKVLWKFKSEGGPFDASVALADVNGDGRLDVLAADSSTGTLFCLDGKGQVQWKIKLPNSTDSPPAVADLDGNGKPEIVVGTMALAGNEGREVVIDPLTQRTKWEAKIPGHVQSEPALVDLNGDGTLDVIVTTWHGDKSVHALSGKDGSPLWTHKMAGEMYHGVSIVPGRKPRVVAASTAGDICLLSSDGAEIWAKKIGAYFFGPTEIGDLDGDKSPEIVACDGHVHVLDLDGREKWQSPDFGSIARGVAIADADGDGKPDLLFGASDGKFRALDGRTGKEIWNFDASRHSGQFEDIDSGPVVADFQDDGFLDVFFVEGKGTSDATRPQNFGRAYALRMAKGKGGWPMFRGNLRRTGSH